MMNVSNKNRNYFCAGGTDGQFYWLVFVRNEKPTRGSSIPRYTNADKEILAATLKDDIIKPGLTFGNLYASQTTSTLVPIEEGLLERCFFGRIVLTGDSWHKVNQARDIIQHTSCSLITTRFIQLLDKEAVRPSCRPHTSQTNWTN
jgi:hypothetical protein